MELPHNPLPGCPNRSGAVAIPRRTIRPLVCAAATFLQALAGLHAQGIKLQQGYLEPVIARVNQPGKISVAIHNTGTTAIYNHTVQLVPPPGTIGVGASASLTADLPLLAAGEIKLLTWDVQSSIAAKGNVSVLVKEGPTTRLNTTFPIWWHDPRAQIPTNYVPEPAITSTGPLLVGAMACPFWRDTAHGSIHNYPDRKPALGYYDEGDFEATDWQVKWALENGVSYFVSCWYRNESNVGKPQVVPKHHRWLEGGFLNGRYGSMAKFAIMSVGDVAASRSDMVNNLFPYWLENYFKRDNYLIIDNKPILFFFDIPLPTAEMALAVSEMRGLAQNAGFAGLHVIASYNGFNSAGPANTNQVLKDAGMDYSFAYHLPTFMGVLSSQTPSATEVISAHQQVWDAQQQGVIPNFVTVSSGWNSEPWGNSVSSTKWRLNPANYATLLGNAKTELQSRSGGGLETKILLLDNWDEWGEGHFIGVTREHAWDYLSAVRQVFGTGATPGSPPAPLSNLSPTDTGRGTPYYDGQDRAMHVLASVGALAVMEGGSRSFTVKLSAQPQAPVTVTNSCGQLQSHATISSGATMTFTPQNWNTPQTVTVTGLAANQRKLYAFSSAGGTSGYADDWVQLIVYPAPAQAPATSTWVANANGSWSNPANWQSGIVPAGVHATAVFGNPVTNTRTITTDATPITLANFIFSPTGSHNWILTGDSINLAPASSITVNGNTATIGNNLEGISTLAKLGAGSLLLSGNNGYTGGTTVHAGTLQAGSSTAFGTGAVSIENGANLSLPGWSLPVDVIAIGSGINGGGAIINTGGTNGSIQNLALFGDTTISSSFAGLNISGGIAGGGHTLTVKGNGTSGYVGIGRGQSDLGDINVLSGSLIVNGYLPDVRNCLGRPLNTLTLSPLGALTFTRNGSVTHDKRIASEGGTIRQSDSPTGSPILAGEIILHATTQVDVAHNLSITGAIAGNAGLVKTGVGTLVLAGANAFTGPTQITAGTLQLANPMALQMSTLDYSTGSLSFGSLTSATLGGLAGSLNLPLSNVSSSPVSLSLGGNGESTTFSGILSGQGNVVKQGSGVSTLAAQNTYSGGSTVTAGILKSGSITGFGSNVLTVLPGGTAELNGLAMIAQHVIASGSGFNGGGALANNSPLQARIASLTMAGDTTLYSKTEGLNILGTVAGGGHRLTVSGAGNGYVGIGNGPSDIGDIDVLSGSLYANGFLGPVSQSLGRPENVVTVSAAGTLGFPSTGNAVILKNIVLNGGRIYQFLSGSPTLQGAITLNADSSFEVVNTLTLTGSLSGVGELRKSGVGVLGLSTASSHTGNSRINAGTLRLNAGGSLANSPQLVVAAGATLDVLAHPAGYTIQPQQTLGGSGTVNGNLIVKGTISPGESLGTLTVTGDVEFRNSVLMIEIGDSQAPASDQLVVERNLNLSGANLNFETTGPLTQPVYVIASYATLSGQANLIVNQLPPSYLLDFQYNGQNQIALVAQASPPGYATWAIANNITGGPNGDSDADGIPNLIEYATLTNLTGSGGSVGTLVGNLLSFNKRPEAVTHGDLTYVIETSPSLASSSWTPVVTHNPGNPSSTIFFPLPSDQGKIFARLLVTLVP